MVEDNTYLESSSPVSLSSQHTVESSSSVLVDEKSKVIEDAERLTLGQDAVLAENTGNVQTKVEETAVSSSGVHDISSAPLVENSASTPMESQNFIPSDEPSEHQVEPAIVQSGESSECQVEHAVVQPDESKETQGELAAVSNGASGETSTKQEKQVDLRPVIDTSAPIESVKDAASKFGGITDWKTHKVQTEEKRKIVEIKLEKVQKEIPKFKKQTETAEDAKSQVLNELDSTKRLIEELKLNLERAQTEENQAKQDSELAKLRVEEVEKGIAEESSVAAKAQLEVSQARHTAAVEELKSVKEELERLRAEYFSLATEKDLALKKAEETVSKSKEVEKTVEELTLDLMVTKESLESAHVAHMEAEDRFLKVSEAKEQDSFNWEKELKQAEEELENLNHQLLSKKDLESRLETTTKILHNLEAECSAYTEEKTNQEHCEEGEKLKAKDTNELHLQEAVASAKKELEEVRINIEKATTEVNYLKVASVSLTSELEKEKPELVSIKKREGKVLGEVASLETDLNRTKLELALAQMKEKEAREKMVDVPKSQLQQAAEQADQAKSLVLVARDELRKVKEEAELVKASASTIESRLQATQKEIEAAKASERLAIAAAKALESESTGPVDGVTLPIEEYNGLSKRAQEAEDQANMRVAALISQIKMAKESELRSLMKLEEVNKGMVAKKEELRIAKKKAEKAVEAKQGTEQELRKWRDENIERRRASDVVSSQRKILEERAEPKSVDSETTTPIQSETSSKVSSMLEYSTETDSSSEQKMSRKKKKKKSLFPRIIMYLSRRKSLSPKVV